MTVAAIRLATRTAICSRLGRGGISRTAGVGALLLLLRPPCVAQVEITPRVGVYGAISHLFDYYPPCPGGVSCLYPLPLARVGQPTAGAAGVGVTEWMGKHIALDVALSYAGSGGIGYPSLNVSTGRAGLLVAITPKDPFPASLYILAGAAFVDHSGKGYQDLGAAETNWGAHIAVGARGPLARGSRFALRAELGDFIYAFTAPAGTTGPHTQHDLLFWAGPSITVGHVGKRVPQEDLREAP